MADIHRTAIVEKGAELAEGVAIGPYCVVGSHVTLAEGVRLLSHVVIAGITSIGPNTHIYPFASIGSQPQDLKYKGEPSKLVVGANNIVREYVTMNPGTEGGGMLTEIGNNCLFMMSTHVAHDCRIGNHVVMANHATLAGHVSVGEWAILGGLSAVHQFVRIGPHAMVGGMSGVEQDVIPYGSVLGNRARLAGLNVIGLRRRGFSRADIDVLRKAYRMLFAEEGTMAERLKDTAEMYRDNKAVMDIIDFIRSDSNRSICQPRAEHGAAAAG
jgi:UDP-N-acetylglucosamine acyltransferase